MFLELVVVISVVINVVLTLFLLRALRRLFQFDDLIGLLSDDLKTNLGYLDKLAVSPVLGHTDEVITTHRNFMIMRDRMNEFLTRMEEVTGRSLRRAFRKKEQSPNPPVVV